MEPLHYAAVPGVSSCAWMAEQIVNIRPAVNPAVSTYYKSRPSDPLEVDKAVERDRLMDAMVEFCANGARRVIDFAEQENIGTDQAIWMATAGDRRAMLRLIRGNGRIQIAPLLPPLILTKHVAMAKIKALPDHHGKFLQVAGLVPEAVCNIGRAWHWFDHCHGERFPGPAPTWVHLRHLGLITYRFRTKPDTAKGKQVLIKLTELGRYVSRRLGGHDE